MAKNSNSEPVKEQREISFEASHFSGPFPPPEVMNQYEQLMPGFTERSFKLFEKQVEHRIQIESKVIGSNSRNQTIGVISAAIITAGSIAGSIWLISIGKDASGLTALISSLVALAGVFIIGKRKQTKTIDDISEREN